jgi:hypothetical protein
LEHEQRFPVVDTDRRGLRAAGNAVADLYGNCDGYTGIR